jgi:hypothetical protein
MPVISGGTIMPGSQYRIGSAGAGGEGANAGAGFLTARGNYNFATEGGAQSTIGLFGATSIPNGAIVIGGYILVTTPIVGAGASIAVQVNAAGDLQAAAAISGAPWSTAGVKNIIPRLNDAATWITLTAARDISVVISAAAVTAGLFDVYLFWLPPS